MTRRRAVLGWSAVIVVAVGLGLAAGPGGTSRPAFDPRSSSGNGTKALVLLAAQLGARVTLTTEPPGPNVDVAVVFRDQLSDDRRQSVAAWVRAGGTLVLADPGSDLQPTAPARNGRGFVSRAHVDGPCPVAGLDDVSRVATGGSYLLRPVPGAVGCFGDGGAYLLVTQPEGRGRLFAFGGAGAFTNAELGKDDNSVLAADLLLVHPGAQVDVMLRSPVGGGRRSLWQLLGRSTKLALVQLFVAVGVVALWRARRLGRPVAESQAVELPGSELTVAVGDLLARAGRRDAAAIRLRHGIRRWMGNWLGLGPSASPEQLADVASETIGLERGGLLAVLEDRPVASDADLVSLAQAVERTRQDIRR